MQCPDCGAYVTKEDQFCGECGRPLAQAAAPDPTLTPEQARDLPTAIVEPARPAPATRPAARPAAPPRKAATSRSGGSRTAILMGIVAALAGLICLCVAGLVIWGASQDGDVTPPVVVVEVTDAPPSVNVNAVPGATILEDDFEDPESGWDVYNNGDTLALYLGGEYRLGVYAENYITWGNPESALDLTDFEIEVDARQVEGPLDNNFGILLRYQPDDEAFYWFQISSDGYYSVSYMQGDDWLELVTWETSEAIQQGLNATNHIKVSCVGNRYAFYVNDQHLTTFEDNALSGGSIGLAAGTFDEVGVVIHFDNLKVQALEE